MGSGCTKQAAAVVSCDTTFNDAIASGKIKPLRLVSLSENGDLSVQSVEHEFTDEYFAKIGICSYTWGHDRVDWYDSETELTWKISNRAEEICRAALEFFDQVWLDGLCMVQAWPAHIKLNMGFMGKLYYHGTVFTEMSIGLRPEYCYRGWVQQEISFTKVICVIKPLNDFLKTESGKAETAFIETNKRSFKGSSKMVDLNIFTGKLSNQKVILKVLDDVAVYLLGIQRVLQGRDDEDLSDALEEIISEIDGIEFWLSDDNASEKEIAKSSLHVYRLFNELLEKVSPIVKLPREVDEDKVLMGALSSYRTGFFRFNSDRIVASFSLAEYVLNKGPVEIKNALESFLPNSYPSQRVNVVIANPGKWCSGINPKAGIQTIKVDDLVKRFLPFVTSKEVYHDFPSISKKANLDLMFSVIHGVDVSTFKKYEYVAGYKKIDETVAMLPDYGIFLGIRNTKQPKNPILRLINVTVAKSLSFLVSKSILGATNDWLARAVALLNSSYYVYQLGPEKHSIRQRPSDITEDKNLPESDYFTPIFGALQFAQFILGAVAEYASFNPIDGDLLTVKKLSGTTYKGREKEVLDMMDSVVTEELEWGGDSWEHTEF